jgi:tRNA(Ile)-lysidine synthase
VANAQPVEDREADLLFAGLTGAPALVLAVSGGADSTALMVLAARWRKRRKRGPQLIAITVDHGLRAQAAKEAAAVKRLAGTLGILHRTVKWKGSKPSTGIQAKARAARYDLLAKEARRAGATHIVTAHTLDDQAETVMFRLARGSGVTGLAAMARATPHGDLVLARPLLELPKARLVATLAARRIAFAEDPSNGDPKYTRVRWRALMPQLAVEGLHAPRLAALALRMRRADAALDRMVAAVAARVVVTEPGRALAIDAALFADLPEEVALRLLGRMTAAVGDEGEVELGKLESLVLALSEALSAGVRFRRTLAGAMITLARDKIVVERAPPRRKPPGMPRKRPYGG